MVCITIPLVLAVTFLAMQYWGIGLHKISLGSLIIALGLLVDDAIIAAEMMVRKLEEGYTMFRAATFTWDATAMPMLTGDADHSHRLFAHRVGQVVGGRIHICHFAVTVIALVLSWVAAVVCALPGVKLLKVKPHLGDNHEVFDGPFVCAVSTLWLTLCAAPLDPHRCHHC